MPEATAPLLVEIGCEELPARMVGELASKFAENLKSRLKDARLIESEVSCAWTPRRLIVFHPEVRLRQPVAEEEVIGPPARIAYKPDGSLSPQGLGFAAKSQVAPESVYRTTNTKGEYVAAKRSSGGADAGGLLLALIPQALDAVPLPRAMTWGTGARFPRPVRWLLALHGSEVIPFRWSGLTAGRKSRGHRTLGAAQFAVGQASEYPDAWEANFVMTSPSRRQAVIAAPPHRGDAELEQTLVNLTEWPGVIAGSFDGAYLAALPEEVLVTVMRDHQKYLAVEENGVLAAKFLAIINQVDDPKHLIRHGNERVLRARFSDAQFFFDLDKKRSLRDRLPLLEQVTFQAKLGSYGDKARRMQTLAGRLGGSPQAQDAALLAKCDLTTEMVKEFPELQGIMGGHYARAEGLPEAVAEAIADQYWFERAPRSMEGAFVSLADKFDTLAGMFALGEIPSGSADPFGLRRMGNSIVRTLVERRLPCSLRRSFTQALESYGDNAALGEVAPEQVDNFFKDRLSFYLREAQGASANQAAAVLAAGSDDAYDAALRCAALSQAADLSAVAAVVKRARSIVRKEGGLEHWLAQPVSLDGLGEPAEVALREAVAGLEPGMDYARELAAIPGLAAPLEQFFNQVRVNDEDRGLRAARLALLAKTVARLNRVADFAELAVG